MEPTASTDAPVAARTSMSVFAAALFLIAGAIVLLWFAPGSYEVYKALHVLAIVIWVGGDMTLPRSGSSSSGGATARRWRRWAR